MGARGNLFVGRQSFTWTTPKHTIKAGGEWRGNRDTTYFGIGNINGSLDVFGGGTLYAPLAICSLSGATFRLWVRPYPRPRAPS